MGQPTCSTRNCERLASGAPDSQGDLCGDCRTAEHALGREAGPLVGADHADGCAYYFSFAADADAMCDCR